MVRAGRWIVGLLILVLIVSILVWRIYGGFLSRAQDVDMAWSQVENVLQRRNDLIPNLVATVKGYARHERELFDHVADARTRLAGARTVEEKVAAANDLGNWLSRLLMIVENYPQLRASENFLRLQDELAGTENRISVERRRYNQAVRDYNVYAKAFPQVTLRNAFGFPAFRTYFEAAPEAARPPQVRFDE